MKTKAIILIVTTFFITTSFNSLFAQKFQQTENLSAQLEEQDLTPLTGDKCSMMLKEVENKTSNNSSINHDGNCKSLQERVNQLEAKLKPLSDKIDVLKSIIYRYEVDKKEYETTNWEIEP
jgi:peptidoglycan hydrolase CwlO-like protein